MRLSPNYDRAPILRNQSLIGFGLLVGGLVVAWEVAAKIAANDMRSVIFAGAGFAACAVAVTILRNWRTGFYMFLIWMMFEDLLRKFMGNGLALFFGKDILLALIYISFFAAVRKHREKTFRPPFLFFLSLFFWLGVLQIFNSNSPSIWYGLLGIKVYFYYVPLMFVGYALVRSDDELRKFLSTNTILAIVVGAVGIMQSILGNKFMNPGTLPSDLVVLGDLQKSTLSGDLFNLPDSVFVSSGRYAEYLTIAFVLLIGTAGYLLLHTKRTRNMTFVAIGLLGTASLLSGSRGCFLTTLMTAVLLSIGFLWGAPWRWRQAYRITKAIRRSVLVGAAGLVLIFFLFPQQAGTRLQYYAETLLPSGGNYELGFRAWDYPIQNFLGAFSQPNWALGNGIGTAALGTQYVARLVGHPAPTIGVEEGYGSMIVEMGVIAPMLWLLWTCALMYYSWKVIRSLRETRFFPVALSVGWYAFILLFLWTYGSLVTYENYTCNVFLWLLVGVLFRLPDLALTASAPTIVVSNPQAPTPGLQF